MAPQPHELVMWTTLHGTVTGLHKKPLRTALLFVSIIVITIISTAVIFFIITIKKKNQLMHLQLLLLMSLANTVIIIIVINTVDVIIIYLSLLSSLLNPSHYHHHYRFQCGAVITETEGKEGRNKHCMQWSVQSCCQVKNGCLTNICL